MLVNSNILYGIILLCGSALVVFASALFVLSFSPQHIISKCDSASDAQQVDCVYRIVDGYIAKGDISGGFKLFGAAYSRYHSFAGTGCHRHAHRMGDMVYYNLYLSGSKNINDIYFPQDTTACGYGFFHGFIEHLIQDNPNPLFVTEVCTHLTDTLSDRMGNIEIICYHGSGHGFVLHHSETVREDEWGNVLAFAEEPIRACESLPGASDVAIEECRQGVFNIIVDWMSDEEYGFAYNWEDPLKTCRALEAHMQYACYYEMSQKLDTASNLDPRKIMHIASEVADKEAEKVIFATGIAGMVQQTIVEERWKKSILPSCVTLPSPFDEYCIEGLVHGLFEHGPPLREYEFPLYLCSTDLQKFEVLQDVCYKASVKRLERFYDDAKVGTICATIPQQYMGFCKG